MRIRRSDDFAEQTIKCRGQAVGGLHARPEYNAPVAWRYARCLTLFLTRFGRVFSLRDAIQGKPWWPSFSTDFLRRHWLIAFEGAEIELAWDQGEIVGVARQEPASTSWSLSSNPARRAPCSAWQNSWPGLAACRLGAQSKAQRGYRLAGLGKPLALQALPALIDLSAADAAMRITAGLQHWQHHEQYWLEQMDAEARGAGVASSCAKGMRPDCRGGRSAGCRQRTGWLTLTRFVAAAGLGSPGTGRH